MKPARRAGALSPAEAGFRPAAAALAIAAAFTLQALPARAQPVPLAVIHGGASFVTNGSNLTVTTTNGAGTNHSAIDWSSFSVPAGSVTRFIQPSAGSTSINRVVAANPSQILGRLTSNGRLVLVNPWGIAVGQGAQVDTAGFVASTLSMTDADALAGRLRFGGGGALLQVDGAIKAQGGDVVLIAPQVNTGAQAVIESDGAAVLAAGQKVEVTGRGLEGILMEVQAGNEAVNLGSLRGDAVGIFAGTLRHSGLIQAQAVSTEGGKVVLQAAGDAIVDGAVSAQGAQAQGGRIDVFGNRVALTASAALDASGAAGGGQVRVGGDYQGRNPDVPNAQLTYVDAGATIRADATQSGNGGRIIAWADDATRMDGQVSARGGASGGNGGFVETSGKGQLAFGGDVDLRARAGASGTLLLDPTDITILASGTASPNPTTFTFDSTSNSYTFANGGGTSSSITARKLSTQLASGNVLLTTTSSGPDTGNITQQSGANVSWTAPTTLALNADAGIALNGSITNPAGGLSLVAHNGNIDAAAATLQVAQLYAEATSASTGGNVNLTNAANQVGTIAGSANGPGASFSLVNANAVTIGMVGATAISPQGLGIAADTSSATSPGTVSITALTGNVTVASSTPITAGGAVLLKAQGGDVVLNDAAIVNSQSGAVTLDASRDVLVAKGVSSNSMGSTGIDGDTVLLQAGRNVELATQSTVPAGGYAPSVFIGGTTHVTLSAGSGVLMGTPASGTVASTFSGTSSTSSAPVPYVSFSGGAMDVSATAGTVDFGTTAYVQSGTAPINITAGTSIGGHGMFFTDGGTGSVTLTAKAGSASFGSIVTEGSSSAADGGSVSVNATGDITGGLVRLSGYDSPATANGGNGGNASLVSSGGSILVGAVGADGGTGSNGFSGGNGGTILLQAKGTGTAAGNITVLAPTIRPTNVDTATPMPQATGLSAHGGSSDAASSVPSAGGNAGSITVDAARDVAIGDATLSTLAPLFDASGGSGITTAAGSAAGGAGGSISLASASGSVSVLTGTILDAAGGTGSVGAKGGAVTVNAGTNVMLGQILANGSSADGSVAGAAGGAGGTLAITAGGNINVSLPAASGSSTSPPPAMPIVNVSGGDGSDGAAGAAGSISISSSGGSLVASAPVGQNTWIEANGGKGAVGGLGGTVAVQVAGDLQVPQIQAEGGQGIVSTGSATSGNGGSVQVRFGGALPGIAVAADGGGGSSTSTGGGGGTIGLTRVGSGTFVLDGNSSLLAQGGAGVITVAAQGGSLALGPDAVYQRPPVLAAMGFGAAFGTGAVKLQASNDLTVNAAVLEAATSFSAQAGGALAVNTSLSTQGGTVTLQGASVAVTAAIDTTARPPDPSSPSPVTGVAPGADVTITGGQVNLQAPIKSGVGRTTVISTGTTQLGSSITSSATGDAITISAAQLLASTGSLVTPNGRWLVYLANLDGNDFGSLQSGNHALWARPFVAGSQVAESGNRYLFAQAPVLQVTADPESKVYDGTATWGPLTYGTPAFVDATKYQNAFLQDDASLLTGSLAIQAPGKDVGSYVIGAGSLSVAAGYQLGFTPGTATITPAPLTIRPLDQAKDQGTAFTFNGTEFQPQATGVANETITSVALSSAGAPASAPAGTYAIHAQGATGSNGFLASNYAITYNDGAFTVRAAATPAPTPVIATAVAGGINQVVTFAQAFVDTAFAQQQASTDDDRKTGKDDIVITDTSCKP